MNTPVVDNRNGTQDCTHDAFLQPSLHSALQAGLRRVRSWPVPPNWSARDWHEEMEEVGAIAAVQAVSEFDPARALALEVFIYHRVIARALTCYRREWSFSLRCRSLVAQDTLANDTDDRDPGLPPNLEPRTQPDHGSSSHEVREAIALLPETAQRVLIEIFWYGFTESELAVEQGLSQRAISKRKQVALKHLRGLLARNGNCPARARSLNGYGQSVCINGG